MKPLRKVNTFQKMLLAIALYSMLPGAIVKLMSLSELPMREDLAFLLWANAISEALMGVLIFALCLAMWGSDE